MRGVRQVARNDRFPGAAARTALAVGLALLLSLPALSRSADLEEIQKRGVLIHLGVPYANFVTGGGDGLDVELMKLFARDLGVGYRFVPTTWEDVIPDLIGKRFSIVDGEVRFLEDAPVKGDVIANGLTILPQREKTLAFGEPTFPTQVWLVARYDSPLAPIAPSGNTERDIASVKSLLRGREVLGVAKTCLEPELYRLGDAGAECRYFSGSLNELAPAIIHGEAELTLLDVPDAILALEKWPGKLKVIGPISPAQEMSCGFPKTSVNLRLRFNEFFERIKRDGTYMRLVREYYPTAPEHFPEFFRGFQEKP